MSSEKLSKLQGHEYNHADCILEGQLYLGNLTSSRDRELQQDLGITHILSVLNGPDTIDNESVTQLKIDVFDDPEEDLISHFGKCIAFIEKAFSGGGKVLVHCHAGLSRSATVVTAFIMKTKGWALEQALDFVRDKRPSIRPNEGFMNQLLLYESNCGRDGGIDESSAAMRAFRLRHCDTMSLESLTVSSVSLRGHRVTYRCRKCRVFLASSETSFPHTKGQEVRWHSSLIQNRDDSKICCQGLFIQPHDWMSLDMSKRGQPERLNCQKCNARLGSYCLPAIYGSNSTQQVSCACGATMTAPSFIINLSKVDKCSKPS